MEPLEWLETDGLGGFSFGCADTVRRRRYHGLMVVTAQSYQRVFHATHTRPKPAPSMGRIVLVAGLEVWLTVNHEDLYISEQNYAPDVRHPTGRQYITSFSAHPWPIWEYHIPSYGLIHHSVISIAGGGDVLLEWKTNEPHPVQLHVRPLLAGRDYHHLLQEHQGFNFETLTYSNGSVVWHPRSGIPSLTWLTNGKYQHTPQWYRQFKYTEETNRGLDDQEDLPSPGIFTFNLSSEQAAQVIMRPGQHPYGDVTSLFQQLKSSESLRRRILPESDLSKDIPTKSNAIMKAALQAVSAYIIRRDHGTSIIAGYPWFTDWGRDTFISLRGLCLSTGRLDIAGQILTTWSKAVSEGMLPNRFTDTGGSPEYNSADASLWFIICVYELIQKLGPDVDKNRCEPWLEATRKIIHGYYYGTRHQIKVDSDGLLSAGTPGQQLTWMDAKVGDWVVTPRIGKPVELQALWCNALWAGAQMLPENCDLWMERYQQAKRSFSNRFITEATWLVDVVDVNHVPGTIDNSLRPNQLFALGALPKTLVDKNTARKAVDTIEQTLVVPGGIRTLAPDDTHYQGHYRGSPLERDGAYHQGTAWPWLLGPFIEAWLNTRTQAEQQEQQHIYQAHKQFIEPWTRLSQGSGHFPEIIDGDAPHQAKGAPFQAWSLGEWLRIHALINKHANLQTEEETST